MKQLAPQRATANALVVVLLLLLFLIISVATAVDAAPPKKRRVNCPLCTRTGRPYICRTPFTSLTCTNKGGESICNTDTGCVCCSETEEEGCVLCDVTTDQFADDEELFSGVAWPDTMDL